MNCHRYIIVVYPEIWFLAQKGIVVSVRHFTTKTKKNLIFYSFDQSLGSFIIWSWLVCLCQSPSSIFTSSILEQLDNNIKVKLNQTLYLHCTKGILAAATIPDAKFWEILLEPNINFNSVLDKLSNAAVNYIREG